MRQFKLSKNDGFVFISPAFGGPRKACGGLMTPQESGTLDNWKMENQATNFFEFLAMLCSMCVQFFRVQLLVWVWAFAGERISGHERELAVTNIPETVTENVRNLFLK